MSMIKDEIYEFIDNNPILIEEIEDSENIVVLSGEENIAELSDGLAGELYTENGWIELYSEQRKIKY